MRYLALAADYDGTLATDGRVDAATLAGLERLLASGRKLILVTGRELDDLLVVFPQIHLCELVVAENGALLYWPASKKEKVLGAPPPEKFLQALTTRGVAPVSTGRVITATWEPHETAVLEVIRDLGLELQVIFNKGAVMVLPAGINKATGLKAALDRMGLSPHNVVGVGDAENDHAFLRFCEFSVAVANALPTVKESADFVAKYDHGAGVVELIDELLAHDLQPYAAELSRHHILLGQQDDGTDVRFSPYGLNILLAGSSGSGKSTLATGMLERLIDQGYQFCIVDPEGDYEVMEEAVVVGSGEQAPSLTEVVQLLEKPRENAVVNLVGLSLQDRPTFFQTLLPRLQELRAKKGRPHWIVVDEAHHLIPGEWTSPSLTTAKDLTGMILVTVHPDQVSRAILSTVDLIIAIGQNPDRTIQAFAKAVGEPAPSLPGDPLPPGEAWVWKREKGAKPFHVRVAPSRTDRQRHRRKYTEGELPPDLNFYFRGPHGKLNLRAQNLMLFVQLAEGVDDETWLYHLQEGDYSRWFRDVIKNEDLAARAVEIEADGEANPTESRARIRAAIEEHYTLPSASPATATVERRRRPEGA